MTVHAKSLFVAATLGTTLGCAPAQAADLPKDYPGRPIRLIVPFPPGGSNDILGRFMAARLTDRLGQQVIVDNRPGADGMIGSDIAARAVPDGHTILLIVSTSYSMNPAIHKKMLFDPVKDLAPIALIGTGPNAITTNPSQPITSVKELIAAAKAKPGQVNYASSGIGGFNHFGGELFQIAAAGVQMTHIPYKGGGPAMIDLMAGPCSRVVQHADPGAAAFAQRQVARDRNRRRQALARIAECADRDRVWRTGLRSHDLVGLPRPAGMPPTLIAGLNDVVAKILQEPETVKRLANEAAEPAFASPAEFAQTIRTTSASGSRSPATPRCRRTERHNEFFLHGA
jgi:tripartite-type tricarboxylate transporter receptor subunit TctC